ncbi:Methyltransferase type 11 [Niveomyces insectorum RCEF 264]|uniref:Methyltransferase type 11 n=1 Tax=Niveomyces insectorum RCEF 264 TaxID=1081102 RepID=A0A167RHF5_9HYPO|nr:Methyltransferase type 11 [Niveomyces insectorum RCEF 264]
MAVPTTTADDAPRMHAPTATSSDVDSLATCSTKVNPPPSTSSTDSIPVVVRLPSGASSTTSITPEDWATHDVGGRRYAPGTWHLLFRWIENGALFLAPLRDEPLVVVDLCTGTGVWASEFASRFPQSTVYATDISLLQPSLLPANCQVIMENINSDEWLWRPSSVDYFHICDSSACVRDWSTVLARMHTCLKPDGLVEAVFFLPGFHYKNHGGGGGNSGMDGVWLYWSAMFALLEPAHALDADVIHHAGFEIVFRRCQQLPLGRWATSYKDLGCNLLEVFVERIAAINTYISGHAGLDTDTIRRQTGILQAQLRDNSKRIYVT